MTGPAATIAAAVRESQLRSYHVTRACISASLPAGELTPGLEAADRWTDEAVSAAGIPVRQVELVTVGGGIGSFVAVDYLRIAGVPKSSIRVLTRCWSAAAGSSPPESSSA